MGTQNLLDLSGLIWTYLHVASSVGSQIKRPEAAKSESQSESAVPSFDAKFSTGGFFLIPNKANQKSALVKILLDFA